MIVKIKNDTKKPSQSFVYCEGDTIIPNKIKDTLTSLQKIYNSDTLYITTVKDTEKETEFIHISIYKKHKAVQWIVTNHRCYLMNDEGKTIDKL